MMTIRVLSLDFDGCLFNSKMLFSNLDIISANSILLNSILQDKAQFSRQIAFVGSNRQSHEIDQINGMRGGGSCFPAIKAVADHLGAEFGAFLMADLYGDLPDGESHKRAISGDSKAEHKFWRFDENKASILYAQMHKIANDNSNEPIFFDFFDDKGMGEWPDILGDLKKVYKQYPELMPTNVTLRLHHYKGDKVTQLAVIEGTGMIDTNYRQTVKDMATRAMHVIPPADGINAAMRIADHIHPMFLKNRVAKTEPASAPLEKVEVAQSVEKKAKQPITNPLLALDPKKARAFLIQLKIIKEKAQLLNDEGHEEAALAAMELYNSLHQGYIKLKANPSQYADEFQDMAYTAIDKAHQELDQHRGWKEFLGNLAYAVLGLGIGLLIKGLVNLAHGKPFLFFAKTDSTRLLETVEEKVNAVAVA